MDEATTNCSKCGTEIYVNSAHPVRYGKNEEVKQRLCDTCCPNCFGGEGNGPSESQPGSSRPGSSAAQPPAIPLEVGDDPHLGQAERSAGATDGEDIVIPS